MVNSRIARPGMLGKVMASCANNFEKQVLDGVMFNKDITHPRMRREIKNPRAAQLQSF